MKLGSKYIIPEKKEKFNLFKFLSSNFGTAISLLTIGSVIFGVGYKTAEIIKNMEILDLKKEFALKEIQLEKEMSKVEIENKNYNIKISEYEKRKK